MKSTLNEIKPIYENFELSARKMKQELNNRGWLQKTAHLTGQDIDCSNIEFFFEKIMQGCYLVTQIYSLVMIIPSCISCCFDITEGEEDRNVFKKNL